MTTRIVTTSVADCDAFNARDWWRDTRPAAPTLFEDELTKAFALLVEQPEAGLLSPRPGYPKLRRLLMRRARYLVFYEYDADANEVLVRRIWGAVQGRPPRMGRR